MKNKYYKFIDKKIVPCFDLQDWAQWFEHANRKIKLTKIKKNIEVSTVFLSIDHAFFGGTPVLFETMVFGGKYDGHMLRYTTYEDSLKGHENMVNLCKSEFIHLAKKAQKN